MNVNYTQEQVAEIVNGYKAGETVEALAAKVGKSVKSITAKLSREGVYQAKTVTASHKVTKSDLITKLAQELQIDPTTLASLEKSTKEALEALVTKIVFTSE